MKRALLIAAGVALGAAAASCAAEELGRLFFTPQQRDALDARRKARLPDKPAAAAVSPTTRLDGYVKRSSGPSTVWVNRESRVENGEADAPRIGHGSGDAQVSIPVGEGGARVRLRPGETLDRGSGEVRDVLRGGEIKVHPSPQSK